MPRTPAYPSALISALAAHAGSSTKTIKRYLQGVSMWRTTRARIEAALVAHDRADLVRPAPQGEASAA